MSRQQIVATRGRHQIVTLDGQARDAVGIDRARYAVTTLGGAVIQHDLTHDEAQAWLERLHSEGAPASQAKDSPPAPSPRATHPRR